MYKVITLLGPMLGMIGSSYIMHYFAISGLASYEVTEDSANHVLKDYEFGPEGDIAEALWSLFIALTIDKAVTFTTTKDIICEYKVANLRAFHVCGRPAAR